MENTSDINFINKREDIRSLTRSGILSAILELSEKKFRADQLFDWLHNKCVDDFDDMKNLPKELKKALSEKYELRRVIIEDVLISKIDGTRKYLMRLDDGNIVECVLMRYEYGNSICISSQVGCRMGCRFCASTLDGLVRNLTAGEMLGQIYAVKKDINEKIGHVVIMGSGEPMDNFDEIVKFLEMITDEKGQNLSGRNITVSTCGLVPKIYELADMKPALTLAISLHATTDAKRREIMPIANKYSINEILDACRYYFEQTGRRLTFEYSLISGVNDTKEDAERLSNIVGGVMGHVNLIPVNPIKERDYVSTAHNGVLAFKNKLEKNHINVTIRREMGRDIEGACGQLRRKFIASQKGEDKC